ncbi:hypothetical protein P3S68_006118 [Capsicum galapagoense]
MDQEDDFPLEGQFYKFKNQKDRILELIWKPYYWFRMLCDELHWSFVSGVVIIYGINQGMSLGLSKISTQYYMKDEQKLQPSEAQIYAGVIQIPWMVKPLWGLLTDTLPIIGYRRRPYFILAGLLGAFAMLSLSLNHKLQLASALLCLTGASAAQAVADVTIDACVTENSISHPSLASDMQSLCGVSSSVGQLIGYTISGFLVHLIGSKGVFGVLSIPAVLDILVGMMLHEPFIHNVAYRQVYAKDGPLFSKEIVGTISSVGAVGYLLGDSISHMIGRLRWMPLLVLSSKLCPSGIEGTFFALLMSIDHVGSLTATWAGGLLLHTLNVTRTQFDNLWMAIVIRSFSRILPIGILFLVPNSDPSASILPAEMLKTKKCDDELDTQKLERAPLVTFVDQHLGDS